MADYKLGEVEMRFANLIWEHEPIASGELAKLSEKELNWKKSTTYTILKRFCERELFQNENGIVTSLVSKQGFLAKQCEKFITENFDGSLPDFIIAFTYGRRLTRNEIVELQRIVDESR